LDAVRLPYGVGAFLAVRSFSPVIQGYGADIDAYTVADADIPIHRHVGPVDTQFARFAGAPNLMPIVFAYNFAFSLKIRVYRQKIHHT
jgi:hypothetical protein